jgi:rsbT co-antagonist protein RsbR
MRARYSWVTNVPLTDPLQREQAVLVQGLLLTLLGMCTLAALVSLSAASTIDRAVGVGTALLLVVLLGVALGVLRRGGLTASVILTSVGVTLLALANMVPSGLEGSRAIFALLVVPILLGGLIGSGRLLWASAALVTLAVLGLTILEGVAPGVVGYSPSTYDPLLTCLSFVLIVAILAIIVDRFSHALRSAFRRSQAREQELELLHASLEQQVAERTAALTQALSEVEAQASAQAQLLAEIAQQREIIRELSVPILPVSASTLVMPLIGALDSARLLTTQQEALAAIERTGARRRLLDLTAVPVIDTYVAQALIGVVQSARLLGAEATLIGIRPEVAQTIVALGVNLQATPVARDLQSMLIDHPLTAHG